VAADLPELRRLVTEYAIGWLVAPADAGAVREGLRAALAAGDDTSLARLVAAAAQQLSWARERRALLGLYAALADRDAERVRSVYGAYGRSARRRRQWAAGNAGNVRIRGELLERVLAATEGQRAAGTEVLDIGCGGGYWLGQLAANGVQPDHLHGADLLDDRVQAARRRVPGATVLRAEGERLPYADGRFGVVLLLTTLSSAGGGARRARILAEGRRLLAADGVLLVYEPRVANPLNRHTSRIARRELDELDLSARHESLTVVPALARRIGCYDVLRRVPALRTHRLSVLRR
jgi:SAM-dependent methyltransferase